MTDEDGNDETRDVDDKGIDDYGNANLDDDDDEDGENDDDDDDNNLEPRLIQPTTSCELLSCLCLVQNPRIHSSVIWRLFAIRNFRNKKPGS